MIWRTRAISDLLNGQGWGLDRRSVRKFVRYCREMVGPDPILRPVKRQIWPGYPQCACGVWLRPRDSKDAAVQKESACVFSNTETETEDLALETSAPVPGVVPVTPLVPGARADGGGRGDDG